MRSIIRVILSLGILSLGSANTEKVSVCMIDTSCVAMNPGVSPIEDDGN
ncbi:hypothetical protein [Deinococcus aquaedulcis]|nr:hypothetical protein [Deinococcus aquaedulcis]